MNRTRDIFFATCVIHYLAIKVADKDYIDLTEENAHLEDY